MTVSHPLVMQSSRDKSTLADQAYPICIKPFDTIVQNSTNAVSKTIYLPKNAVPVGFLILNDVIWDSGTSATLTVGLTAGGTEYLTAVNLKTAAGFYPITATQVTGTQSAAWASIGTSTTMVATATPSGATSTGTTRVFVQFYVPSA